MSRGHNRWPSRGARLVTPRQRGFAALRIALGLFLAQRFLFLIPYAGEVFGRDGTMADSDLNFTAGILPSPLDHWDQPWQVQLCLVSLVALSLLFAAGVARRPAALVLAYGAACLFNRNNLIANPSLPYLGALLLLSCTVPRGEGLSPTSPARDDWFCPTWTVRAVWILLACGYTFSGLDKLSSSPSWRSGDALRLVLELPLARPGTLRELLLSLPSPALRLLSWGALGLEVLALPLWLSAKTRPWTWAALTALQLGILCTLGFAELTCGMLLVHWATLDPTWCASAREGWASYSRMNQIFWIRSSATS